MIAAIVEIDPIEQKAIVLEHASSEKSIQEAFDQLATKLSEFDGGGCRYEYALMVYPDKVDPESKAKEFKRRSMYSSVALSQILPRYKKLRSDK